MRCGGNSATRMTAVCNLWGHVGITAPSRNQMMHLRGRWCTRRVAWSSGYGRQRVTNCLSHMEWLRVGCYCRLDEYGERDGARIE